MKNNLSYYKHDVNSHNHWKFKMLRRKYGWSGEGKFWALNNMIAEADGASLFVGDDKKVVYAADLDFELEEFEEYLTFLIQKCKLITCENDLISTSTTQESLCEVNKKRELQRTWKQKNRTSTEAESNIENEQSKVKKSKVKEKKIKVKEIKTIGDSPTVDSAPASPALDKKAVDQEWKKWVATWFDFFKSRNDDIEPKFDGAQGKALADIRKYLVKVSSARYPDKPPDEAGLQAWQYILAKWDNLANWNKTQYDLKTINSKLNDITAQLKNGSPKANTKVNGQQLNTSLNEFYSKK